MTLISPRAPGPGERAIEALLEKIGERQGERAVALELGQPAGLGASSPAPRGRREIPRITATAATVICADRIIARRGRRTIGAALELAARRMEPAGPRQRARADDLDARRELSFSGAGIEILEAAERGAHVATPDCSLADQPR